MGEPRDATSTLSDSLTSESLSLLKEISDQLLKDASRDVKHIFTKAFEKAKKKLSYEEAGLSSWHISVYLPWEREHDFIERYYENGEFSFEKTTGLTTGGPLMELESITNDIESSDCKIVDSYPITSKPSKDVNGKFAYENVVAKQYTHYNKVGEGAGYVIGVIKLSELFHETIEELLEEINSIERKEVKYKLECFRELPDSEYSEYIRKYDGYVVSSKQEAYEKLIAHGHSRDNITMSWIWENWPEVNVYNQEKIGKGG